MKTVSGHLLVWCVSACKFLLTVTIFSPKDTSLHVHWSWDSMVGIVSGIGAGRLKSWFGYRQGRLYLYL